MVGLISAIILLFFHILSRIEGKVVLNIHIYNYRNVDNLKHDGSKCESFHWMNDHCDPMFRICITSLHPCDILNKQIDFWKNKKTLYTVLTKTLELKRFPRSISIAVKVDDHDRFDEHDHIAVFSTNFVIDHKGKYYKNIMKVIPEGLNVGLQASVMVECAKDYYGRNCDLSQMENECINNVDHGKCSFNKLKNTCNCRCDIGWSGPLCRTFITNDCSLLKCPYHCKYTETLKECACIFYGNDKKICRVKLSPLKKTTPKLYISTKTESTISKTFTSSKSTILSTTKKKKRNLTTYSFPRNQSSFHSARVIPLSHLEIPLPPDSVETSPKHLTISDQFKPADPHKLTNKEIIGTRFAPTTVIIISLLLLLCLCVLGLLIMIRKWHRKNNKKFLWSSSIRRPLPPIIYKNPQTSFKSHIQRDADLSKKSNFGLGSSTSASNSKQDSNLLILNNYEIESGDPYEEPIIDNMESLTCETEYDNSDDSDMYEEPIKLKI